MKRLLLISLVLLAGGCSFFSKSTSKTYTLDPVPAPPVAKTGTAVSIDTIELPPGLDRREIVVRKANQQLEIRANELWPANLQPLVLHTLAFDLASRLPEGMVVLPGQSRPAKAPRGIDVAFEELSAGPDNHVTLDARWTLAGTPHHEHIAIDVPSLDSGAVATGTSQALAALADRIAAAM